MFPFVGVSVCLSLAAEDAKVAERGRGNSREMLITLFVEIESLSAEFWEGRGIRGKRGKGEGVF